MSKVGKEKNKQTKKQKKKSGKFYCSLQMKYSNVTVEINVTRSAVLHCLYCVVQISFPIVYIHKSVEYDRPGEHSPE